MDRVDYQTEPSRYRHWKLKFDGPVATLLADFDENAGLRPGYKLKLNSLRPRRRHRAQRRGQPHPLRAPRSARRGHHERAASACSAPAPTSSCSASRATPGRSTSASSPTRPATASRTRRKHDGLKFLAAVNGSCAGGGYELALACDEIILIDDRSSAVSLPEVPLLGVLPGTGGLTRLTDKRHVRHDLADVFCTTSEGVRGEKALAWRLVDAHRQAGAIRGQGEGARAQRSPRAATGLSQPRASR